MSSEITRKQVDWERASCRGLDTNLFYLQKTELLDEGLSFNHLRRMCFACPIQRECLQIGVKYERYGFWGGVAEDERDHLYRGTNNKVVYRFHMDIQGMSKTFAELKTIIQSVTRDWGEFDMKYPKRIR